MPILTPEIKENLKKIEVKKWDMNIFEKMFVYEKIKIASLNTAA